MPSLERLELGLPLDQESYLVASHPCDVVAWDLVKEPHIDLVPGTHDVKADGNFTYGKNPRILQLETPEGILNADLVWRYSIPRTYLANASPVSHLEEKNRRLFASWLGSRFSRPAFADAFNERTRLASRAISEVVKKKGGKISGIYIAVTDEELPAEKPYDLVLLVCMRKLDFEDAAAWEEVNVATEKIQEILLDCAGINLVHCGVKSEETTTLEELRWLRRWDYDYLTYRSNGDDETLAVRE